MKVGDKVKIKDEWLESVGVHSAKEAKDCMSMTITEMIPIECSDYDLYQIDVDNSMDKYLLTNVDVELI